MYKRLQPAMEVGGEGVELRKVNIENYKANSISITLPDMYPKPTMPP